jgi:hypothetical protein
LASLIGAAPPVGRKVDVFLVRFPELRDKKNVRLLRVKNRPKKQRHASKRIFGRLGGEYGFAEA